MEHGNRKMPGACWPSSLYHMVSFKFRERPSLKKLGCVCRHECGHLHTHESTCTNSHICMHTHVHTHSHCYYHYSCCGYFKQNKPKTKVYISMTIAIKMSRIKVKARRQNVHSHSHWSVWGEETKLPMSLSRNVHEPCNSNSCVTL